jgi:hypothetical protein
VRAGKPAPRPGPARRLRRAQVRFMPGCLLWSLIISVVLTILVNLALRAF